MVQEFEKRCIGKEEKLDHFNKFVLDVQSKHVQDTPDNPSLILD